MSVDFLNFVYEYEEGSKTLIEILMRFEKIRHKRLSAVKRK